MPKEISILMLTFRKILTSFWKHPSYSFKSIGLFYDFFSSFLQTLAPIHNPGRYLTFGNETCFPQPSPALECTSHYPYVVVIDQPTLIFFRDIVMLCFAKKKLGNFRRTAQRRSTQIYV